MMEEYCLVLSPPPPPPLLPRSSTLPTIHRPPSLLYPPALATASMDPKASTSTSATCTIHTYHSQALPSVVGGVTKQVKRSHFKVKICLYLLMDIIASSIRPLSSN